MSIPGDNPIEKPDDDALERAPVARMFAEQMLALDPSEGLVVGVLGPWGSGKTSFINLARADLAQAGVDAALDSALNEVEERGQLDDRLRVEQALSEQGVPGRDYLEKILQLAIDLPSIPSQVLSWTASSTKNDSTSCSAPLNSLGLKCRSAPCGWVGLWA